MTVPIVLGLGSSDLIILVIVGIKYLVQNSTDPAAEEPKFLTAFIENNHNNLFFHVLI